MFINSHPSPPLFHIHHMPNWTCPRCPGLCLFRYPDCFSPRCQPLPGGDSPCPAPAPPPPFSEGKASPLSSWTPFPQTSAQTILTKTHISYHLSQSPGFSPPPSLSSRSPPGTPATPAMTPEMPLRPELPPQPASVWSHHASQHVPAGGQGHHSLGPGRHRVTPSRPKHTQDATGLPHCARRCPSMSSFVGWRGGSTPWRGQGSPPANHTHTQAAWA